MSTTFPVCLVARNVSPRLPHESQLTFIPERQEICPNAAQQELDQFCQVLADWGVVVIRRMVPEDLPDGVFRRDTARIFDRTAVLGAMTRESRQPEIKAIREDLENVCSGVKIVSISDQDPSARLEFGDTVLHGRDLLVCQSTRTNEAGIHALREIVTPLGYRVHYLGTLPERLHLDMALSVVDRGVLLADLAGLPRLGMNGETVHLLRDKLNFHLLETPAGEGAAAACFRIAAPKGNLVVMRQGFPATKKLLEDRGIQPVEWDCSHLANAESGPDCMAIEFYAED